MIADFEKYTEPLTTYEQDMIVPLLVESLKTRIGAKNAICNKDICDALVAKGYTDVHPSRIRKCIHHIRFYGLVPHLLANSKGYYVATSVEEVEKYAEGLDDRAYSIWAISKCLRDQLSGKLFI